MKAHKIQRNVPVICNYQETVLATWQNTGISRDGTSGSLSCLRLNNYTIHISLGSMGHTPRDLGLLT